MTLSCEGCGRRCRSEALSACYNPARSPAWWRVLCSRAFLDRHVRAKRWYPGHHRVAQGPAGPGPEGEAMSRPWLGRSRGLRERFLQWHRHHLPGWALACDLDLVEYRRVEVEPGWYLYSPVALAEGGPEVYAAWLAGQHRRNRSVSTASRRYP